jgi:hypothetical protein
MPKNSACQGPRGPEGEALALVRSFAAIRQGHSLLLRRSAGAGRGGALPTIPNSATNCNYYDIYVDLTHPQTGPSSRYFLVSQVLLSW